MAVALDLCAPDAALGDMDRIIRHRHQPEIICALRFGSSNRSLDLRQLDAYNDAHHTSEARGDVKAMGRSGPIAHHEALHVPHEVLQLQPPTPRQNARKSKVPSFV